MFSGFYRKLNSRDANYKDCLKGGGEKKRWGRMEVG
jgi:hypothetical protein